jgi:hypothetical protein
MLTFQHNNNGSDDESDEGKGAILVFPSGNKNGRTIGVDINNVTLNDVNYDHKGNPISVFDIYILGQIAGQAGLNYMQQARSGGC